ncbi:MAG: Gfo/Idh/MocA family oxidoreductase [Planctomycetales bacterium]|nr:Gfo/Idh/MocA family oxidoreductase [Planctomycetales bacterium]
MTTPDPVSRRNFLGTTSVGALAAATAVHTSSQPVVAQSKQDKIRIAFVGPGGRGFGAHVRKLSELEQEGQPIELVGVCDVYSEHRDRAADFIKKNNGKEPTKFVDHREMYEKLDMDAVCIGTPDHWHAKQAIEAMKKGFDVYCEKPMTKTVDEALAVMKVWQETKRVMQVGVQSTSLPLWGQVNQMLREGKLGKVLMYQTEFFRNSAMGQWRYYKLTEQMSPKTIDWKQWLGCEEGLSEEIPFDRAVYAQWRRFWPFGSGMFTDLFVHRTTSMLKATGLRFPGRVVGAGGVYMEYDGRDVPDVATVVSDFREGVQGMVTATMACQNTPITQTIRGHFGSFVFGNGEQFDSFKFIPERPQVTRNSKLVEEEIKTEKVQDTTYAHFKNWIEAMVAKDPQHCNNPTDLGAAAIANVILGARSYREGRVFHFDADKMSFGDGDSSWASMWEEKSRRRDKPSHIAGWSAGDLGSELEEPEYMKLGGPWKDGKDPARG